MNNNIDFIEHVFYAIGVLLILCGVVTVILLARHSRSKPRSIIGQAIYKPEQYVATHKMPPPPPRKRVYLPKFSLALYYAGSVELQREALIVDAFELGIHSANVNSNVLLKWARADNYLIVTFESDEEMVAFKLAHTDWLLKRQFPDSFEIVYLL